MSKRQGIIDGSGSRADVLKRAIKRLYGSGFDSSWFVDDMGDYVRACTDWHLMNGNGYYMGYYPFYVVIPKNDPLRFRLHGQSRPGTRRCSTSVLKYYGVWDYLQEAISMALYDAIWVQSYYTSPDKPAWLGLEEDFGSQIPINEAAYLDLANGSPDSSKERELIRAMRKVGYSVSKSGNCITVTKY